MKLRPALKLVRTVFLIFPFFTLLQQGSAQVCTNPAMYVYGLSAAGVIYQVNVTNANVAASLNTPYGSPNNANAMGYNSMNGKFYYFNKNYPNLQFISYDPATASYDVLAAPTVTNSVVTGCMNNEGTGFYCLDLNANFYYYHIASDTWTKITSSFTNQYGISITNTMKNLPSGDMAFDGNGNLWFVISSSSRFGLYQLTGPVTTTPVANISMRQVMSPSTYTPDASIIAGIAFNSTGEIFLSTTNNHLYIINDDLTGSLIGTFTISGVGADLTSCNYPMAVLNTMFSSFSQQKNDDKVLLTWQVSHVENITTFYIQYSNDAGNWTTIDSVNSAVSGANHQYSYEHQFANAGAPGYYRVFTIRADGKKRYSTVLKVAGRENKSGTNVWPNPVTNILFVRNLDNLKRPMRIINSVGNVVKQETLNPGINVIELNALPTGGYHVQYQQHDRYVTENVIRQ